jgi:hypothetical protein
MHPSSCNNALTGYGQQQTSSETRRCPECREPVGFGPGLNGVSSVDGNVRHPRCHAKKMASLKDGPGSASGGSPYGNGSAGYVAK